MQITYGTPTNYIDITDYCINNLMNNYIINIPSGEEKRNLLFSDPCPNIEKKIFVKNDDKALYIECNNNKELNIHIKNTDLSALHQKLIINHGDFNLELPEQQMIYMFLTGNEKILEFGGNIGRSSIIASSILKDSKNHLVLETDKNNVSKLYENRNLNNLEFHIEDKALSKKKLIQHYWTCEISDYLKDGYFWVDICDYDYIKNKYNIDFDTLIIDCEGAFYYIIIDFPEIINNINLIIMENDYYNNNHYIYIKYFLIDNGFTCVYIKSLDSDMFDTNANFYEVWKKNTNQNTLDIYVSSN
jgi:FkbM family methyltransferase